MTPSRRTLARLLGVLTVFALLSSCSSDDDGDGDDADATATTADGQDDGGDEEEDEDEDQDDGDDTTTTTEGEDEDEGDDEDVPEQDLEADQAIAEAAVLTEADLPEGWVASAPEEEDEEEEDDGLDDVFGDCPELDGYDLDFEALEALDPPEAASEFELEEEMSFAILASSVAVLPDDELIDPLFDALAAPELAGCLEDSLRSEMTTDDGMEIVDFETAPGDEGDGSVHFSIAVRGDAQGMPLDMALTMVWAKVDRGVVMFMGGGSELTEDGFVALPSEDHFPAGVIDTVLGRLEDSLA
jgi:hypothetical protein